MCLRSAIAESLILTGRICVSDLHPERSEGALSQEGSGLSCSRESFTRIGIPRPPRRARNVFEKQLLQRDLERNGDFILHLHRAAAGRDRLDAEVGLLERGRAGVAV